MVWRGVVGREVNTKTRLVIQYDSHKKQIEFLRPYDQMSHLSTFHLTENQDF